MTITDIKARQILDSRGNPTVEVDVWIDHHFSGRAASPSGASTGIHEAHELRDGETAFHGKGVQQAVQNIHREIRPALLGMHAASQREIDNKMIEIDDTPNKSRLGANAILAVSLAVAHAAAREQNTLLYAHINQLHGSNNMSLPMPMMNVLNGGRHATNSSDIQEFMIIPQSAKTMTEAIQMGAEIFQQLRKDFVAKGFSTAVGDEGGFTCPVSSNAEMFEHLINAVETANYKPGADVVFAIDAASAEFYENESYHLTAENTSLTRPEFIDYLESLTTKYPLHSIEDGLDQDDWPGWTELQTRLGKSVQLVGDDFLVTNTERLKKAINEKAGNAILIKPNQIGTLSETLDAIKLAQDAGWNTIVSHRSGETEDVTIAHIAVGTGAGQIKTGSLSRSERTAKYNELIRIEQADNTLRLVNPLID